MNGRPAAMTTEHRQLYRGYYPHPSFLALRASCSSPPRGEGVERRQALRCRLQAHRRGGALWRGFEAELDARVVAVLVADVEGVVAVARRLPQGLRGVALSQQFAVDQPQVGRVVAVGLQGDGLAPVFDDGAIHRRSDAQDGRGRRRAGVTFSVPGGLRRGVAAWRVGRKAMICRMMGIRASTLARWSL